MKKIIYITVIVLLANIGFVKSQDFHLSQYDLTPMLMNPALTAIFDGDYRVHVQHRSQWGAILDNPYKTEHISFDKPFKRFGAGLFVINNRAGVGKFNFLNIGLSGSYEVTIDPSGMQHLVFGTQIGMVQNSFDLAELTFDNQYTSAFGGSFDQTIDNGENFDKTSVIRPDVNFGVHYMMQQRFNFFNYSVYKMSEVVPFGGAVIFHLTQPKLTFGEYKNILYRRYLVYGGAKIKVNVPLCIEPKILYMRQLNNNEFQFSSAVYYYFKDYNAFAFTNIDFRTKDALIFSIGAIYTDYRISVGYDFNTSPLKAYTKGRGSFEISLTYTKFNNKSYPML